MRLYKYCDVGGIEILRSCAVKVVSPTEVNDPFDCNPVPDNWTIESREAMKSQIQSKSEVWNALESGRLPPGSPAGADVQSLKQRWELVLEESVANHDLVRSSMKDSLASLALLCLSAKKSHHLMWAHYADKHRGMVIEFETVGEFIEGAIESVTNKLYKVVYSDTRPVFRFDSVTPTPTFTTKGRTHLCFVVDLPQDAYIRGNAVGICTGFIKDRLGNRVYVCLLSGESLLDR